MDDLKDWDFMGVYDEPRLTEITQTYIELGIRVKCLDPDRTAPGDCGKCLDTHSGRYKAVYTKKHK